MTHPMNLYGPEKAISNNCVGGMNPPTMLGHPVKRLIDVAFASFGLVFLSPLLIVFWMLVRLTSPGPGLFWSERVGLGGRMFRMPKFRTMRVGVPVQRLEELDKPERFYTPIGRFLRKSSIDELPQLWSVLKGDMSLVGPRPVLPTDRTAIERQILGCPLKVRPGITGLAQVRGRNSVTPRNKARYDALYSRRCCIMLDAKIKLTTVVYVIRKKDIQ